MIAIVDSRASARPARIAVNGLGRIGRQIVRALVANAPEELELVAVNTLERIELSVHLLKYDSMYGRSPVSVEGQDRQLVIGGKPLHYSRQQEPAKLPWKNLAIDMVIECSGLNKKSRGHLEAGATRVIVAGSVPHPDTTLCMGVNHDRFQPDTHRLICGASCTANMVAPAIKVLDDAFGVKQAMVTFIHSYTNDQNLLDSDHIDLRRARSATMNIIPSDTSAISHLSVIFPGLAGKIDGLALRVPTPLVHMANLVMHVNKNGNTAKLLQILDEAASGAMHNILKVCHTPLVSSDFRGWSHSCIVDGEFSQMSDGMIRLVAWHDNEKAYCERIIELTRHMGAVS